MAWGRSSAGNQVRQGSSSAKASSASARLASVRSRSERAANRSASSSACREARRVSARSSSSPRRSELGGEPLYELLGLLRGLPLPFKLCLSGSKISVRTPALDMHLVGGSGPLTRGSG